MDAELLRPNYGKRDALIVRMFKAGTVQARIAADFGITKMRVSQILRQRGISRDQGGASARRWLKSKDFQPDR